VGIFIGEISDDDIRSLTCVVFIGSLLLPLKTVATNGLVFGVVINGDC
jgi:hypothetical protein